MAEAQAQPRPQAVSIDPRDRRDNRGPRRGNDRMRGAPKEEKTFQEYVVSIDRVARVVRGGRRFRFKALVAVGDGKQRVGVGVAKGQDVQMAVQKATEKAKKQLITIPIANATIPHEVEAKVGGAKVLLKPAAPGTGIIAGGVVRSVVSLSGISNLLAKSLGSNNKVNNAYATLAALLKLVPRSEWLTTTLAAAEAPAKKTVKTTKTADKEASS